MTRTTNTKKSRKYVKKQVKNQVEEQFEKQMVKNITQYNIRRMAVGFLLLITIINWIIWYVWDLEIAGYICGFSLFFLLFSGYLLPKNDGLEDDYFKPNEKKEWNTIDFLKGIFFGPIIVFSNCRWCKTKGKLIELLIFGIFLAITYISIPVISWHYYSIRKPIIEEAKRAKKEAERPIKEAQKEAERLREEEREAKERPLKKECKARGQHLYQNENGYYCDNTWYEKLYEISIYGIAKVKTDIEKAQEKNR